MIAVNVLADVLLLFERLYMIAVKALADVLLLFEDIVRCPASTRLVLCEMVMCAMGRKAYCRGLCIR